MAEGGQGAFWDAVYRDDPAFFGEEPSGFARAALPRLLAAGARRVLELGCGHGRDALHLAAAGLQVAACDVSREAARLTAAAARARRAHVAAHVADASRGLPFRSDGFDAIYAHMLFNMPFDDAALARAAAESARVLRPGGLLLATVRGTHDPMLAEARPAGGGVVEVRGFRLRFFRPGELAERFPGFRWLDLGTLEEPPAHLHAAALRKPPAAATPGASSHGDSPKGP